MSRPNPPFKIKRRPRPNAAPPAERWLTTRRKRREAAEPVYMVESDLSPERPVSNRELDALERLLGEELRAFLHHLS
jgi:hypothetical protein